MAEAPTYRNALSLNTILLEYRLESVLGAGGFGITYLGWDTNLEKHVAIKEYLPGELAIRALDGSVLPVDTESEYNYKWGLDRFIQEARTLAKFSHPNIVHVNRFFEANGTSYMVMDYEAGESLHQYLRQTPMPDEAKLKNILMPILDGLQAVHKSGFLHRDIKPSNVFMRENGIPVLLDFGSARMVSGRISKSMTAIVSPGYAPLEQYSNDGHQGPWSDIYALSAVVYRAVTGENPPDAIKRMKSDSVPQALTAARTRYTERFLKAVEWGMTLDEKMRPQSIAEWRDLFLGRAPMTAFSRGTSINSPRAAATAPTVTTTVRAGELGSRGARPASLRRAATNGKTQPSSKQKWLVASGILLVVLALAAMLWKNQHASEVGETRTASPAQRATQTGPQIAPRNESVSAPSPLLPAQAQPAVPQVETGAAMPGAQPIAPTVTVKPLSKDLANKPSMATGVDRTPQPVERAEATQVAKIGGSGDTQIPLPIKKEFEAADRDGNGYLTHEEIRGKFPFIEQNFSQVDSDGDRRISAGEFMQLRKKQQSAKFAR